MKVGQPRGLKPAGLGARDLLRLDMGYLLYGNDISEEVSPLEAGADWVVNFDKGSSSVAPRCCLNGRRDRRADWWGLNCLKRLSHAMALPFFPPVHRLSLSAK